MVVLAFAEVMDWSDRGGLGASVLATTVVAIAFGPAKSRLHRLASRIVYGYRQTPAESLSEFSQRVSGASTFIEMLPEMARVLAQGTGAERASLWLRVGSELVEAASWPPNRNGKAVLGLEGEELPSLPGTDLAMPVMEGSELMGALAISKKAIPITGIERTLTIDLASQAALVLRNARLAVELDASIEEIASLTDQLRASRRLIVEGQDSELRSMERKLHDEAQQYLVALVIHIDRARLLMSRDPDRVANMIPEIRRLHAQVIDVVSGSAGLHSSKLAEVGLVPAMRDHVERLDLPVSFEAARVGRYPAEIEEAVYYTCLEAIQNAVKHSGAREISASIREETGELRFQVVDDGEGFASPKDLAGSGLLGMRQRVEEQGGSLQVLSRPGGGTRVNGHIPVVALAEARS